MYSADNYSVVTSGLQELAARLVDGSVSVNVVATMTSKQLGEFDQQVLLPNHFTLEQFGTNSTSTSRLFLSFSWSKLFSLLLFL